MKYIFVVLIALVCFSVAEAQDTIKLEQAKQHVGDSVTVCGRVDDTRYLVTADNSPTFLNIGGMYPKQLLTVVIWADAREQIKGKPELDFKNKNICITGKIELYKGNPQIVIKKAEQIKLQ
jgi:micrococcal nuclease